jgi:septum formation topological specificity factor MinE
MLVQSRAKENEMMKFDSINMPALQQEVRDVVAKYMKVDQNKPVTVSVNQQGEYDFLEINFPLQDHIHKVKHAI